MKDDPPSNLSPSHESYPQADQPSTYSHPDDYEPSTKQLKVVGSSRGRMTHQMRLPIILPKLPDKPSTSQGSAAIRLINAPPVIPPSVSNPRPLISLLDRTEFRNPSRVILATPPTQKPKKSLSEKLQLLQRLRGENKFLQESIQKKQNACQGRSSTIAEIRETTDKMIHQSQLLRETLHNIEEENERLRRQLN
ncbi:Protein CBG14990 [Caenorhabditis briggsae]|uniref:Protein CBG14990 n=1 Tax=Caenorhabditis briggsae TaxID=6238 RepID=A8XL60_CAEBR|nr:Protein CBG14990 [Caenorhabditis briggsae]CAP33385.2 Protein CBG14990 [Caenorhabditis briggsae]